MVFAAGFGTRMGDLTKDKPKPLIKVAGRALIDHALDHVSEQDRVVVNTHYHADQIVAHLSGRKIAISHESPEILETGGGLRQALPQLGARPVFTMNTDVVWRGPNPIETLANAWRPEDMDALLLCVPKSQAHGHSGNGDFEFSKDAAIRGPGLIYTGVQIIKTDQLKNIDQTVFSLNVMWDKLLEKNRLHIHSYDGHWCDVGHPEGIKIAEAMLKDTHV